MDEAAQEFQEAIRRDPKNGSAHGSLGLIYLRQRRFGEAAARFQSALEMDPSDALAKKGFAEAEAKQRGK